MEITRQEISVNINIAQAAFVTADNTTRGLSKPVMFVGNEVLFTCQLLSANGAAQPLPENIEFYASLDTEYGPNHDDLVKVTHDRFNIDLDWDGIDLSSGKFCFRLTTATEELVEVMAKTARKDVHLEIWFREPLGNWAILLHESVVIRNVTADFNPEPSEGITFATTNDLATRISKSDEGYDITPPPGGEVKVFNPETATMNDVYDFLATLSATLKSKEVI